MAVFGGSLGMAFRKSGMTSTPPCGKDRNEPVRKLERHFSPIKREERCALACRTEYRPKSRVRDPRASRPCHLKGGSRTGSDRNICPTQSAAKDLAPNFEARCFSRYRSIRMMSAL